MTLTDCQLLSIVAQLGTFAAAAERLHIPPSVSNEPNRVGEQPWQNQYMALCFGLSLLGAILITLLIEKPCAWALKKLFTRKQKA